MGAGSGRVRSALPLRRRSRPVGLVAVALLVLGVAAGVPGGPAAADPVAPPAPFSSWADFADQQERDLLGQPSAPEQRAGMEAALADGTLTPGGFVAALRASPDNQTAVDPAVRLYRAFFLRVPDPGGLDFWVSARRTGRWNLTRIASSFAASSEFTNRYGTLTNRAFVLLIYANVLERTPDTGGVDYWTRQLDQKRRTRGTVMIGFSESNEYRAKQASEVTASVLSVLLLGRTPTADEFQAFVARLDGGSTVADEAGLILASPEYATRAARTRVVVLGDSVPVSLLQYGRAGTDLSGYDLVNGAVPACDGVDHPPPSRTVTGEVLDISPVCATGWPAIYPPRLAFRADRAVLMTGPHAMLDHQLDGIWKHPCHAAARTWYHDDLVLRLTYLATRAHRVVLVLPAWPTPGSAWVMPPDAVKRADCVRKEMRRAAADTGTPTIDLGEHLCPGGPAVCPPYSLVDGLHVDPDRSAEVLTWLLSASAPGG